MMTRVPKRAVSVIILVVGLAASAAASADALRCGNRVISRGDHAAKVLRYCGEPVSVQSWRARRGVVGLGSVFQPGFGLIEDVLVEEWTYNFGPRRLMRQVRLENGLVRDVAPLGYGFREE